MKQQRASKRLWATAPKVQLGLRILRKQVANFFVVDLKVRRSNQELFAGVTFQADGVENVLERVRDDALHGTTNTTSNLANRKLGVRMCFQGDFGQEQQSSGTTHLQVRIAWYTLHGETLPSTCLTVRKNGPIEALHDALHDW